MLKRLLFLLPLLIFAVAAGFLYWGLNPERDPSAIPSVLIDDAVPDFQLPAVQGIDAPALSSGELGQGEVTLVNFFASWCLPCEAEHPLFMEMAEERNIRVVGINYKDAPDDAEAWLKEHGNPYALLGADHEGRVGIEWGISGVPETFIIDREGTIRYRHVGPIHPVELEELILPIVERLQ